MRKTVDLIVKQIASALEDQLEAIFLYGSVAQGFHQPDESDVNLFLVTTEDCDIFSLRERFAPIWQDHAKTLKRAPCFANRHAFARHLQLNTLLAHHIVRDGKKLFGHKPILSQEIQGLRAAEAYAHLAYQAMLASQVLMPEVLEEETAVALRRKLHSLVRRIQRAPLNPNETDTQLFARVQNYLNPIIAKLPEVKVWDGFNVPTQTSPFLPGLSAIYEETGKLVLTFAQLTPQQLLRTDWQEVSSEVPDSALGVELTSAAQLYLIASYEHPLHIRFRKYEHSWGPDFIADIDPPHNQVMRQAARQPSEILVNSLPNAFLTYPEEEFHKLIHDFQNKLLNIQLEHELMVRFGLTDRFTPPEPLPGRDEPITVRIEAIFKNLNWWANFYTTKMQVETQ